MNDNHQLNSPERLSEKQRYQTVIYGVNNLINKLEQQFQKAHDLSKAQSLNQQAILEAEQLLNQDLHLERNLRVVADTIPDVSNYPIEVSATPDLDIDTIRKAVDESLAA